MKSVEIKGALRTELAKSATKKLRNEDLVPCVLYGTEAPVHFSTPASSFKKLIYTPDAYLAKVEVDGKSYDAVLQDTQFHPVSDNLLHADFLAITQDKPVTIDIPVTTTGSSVGVVAGGRLVVVLRSVKVKALPKDLPDVITLDVSKLKIGDSIKVDDIQLGEGIELVNAGSAVVVAVRTTRAAMSAGSDLLDEDEAGEEGSEEGASSEEAAEA